MRHGPEHGQAIAFSQADIGAHEEFAQAGAAVAESLHGGLDLARRARGKMQYGDILRVDVHHRGDGRGAGQQRFIVQVAGAGACQRDQRAYRGKARRGQRMAGEAFAGDEYGRAAVGHHIRDFAGGVARVECGLGQARHVQRALDFHELGAVARVDGHAVAFAQSQGQQRIGQAAGALV
ncbi:hypothetical protein D3C71_1644750 [compost metagenome]